MSWKIHPVTGYTRPRHYMRFMILVTVSGKMFCEENIVESNPTSHWSNFDDQDRTAEFIELLKNCLKEFGKGRD